MAHNRASASTRLNLRVQSPQARLNRGTRGLHHGLDALNIITGLDVTGLSGYKGRARQWHGEDQQRDRVERSYPNLMFCGMLTAISLPLAVENAVP